MLYDVSYIFPITNFVIGKKTVFAQKNQQKKHFNNGFISEIVETTNSAYFNYKTYTAE